MESINKKENPIRKLRFLAKLAYSFSSCAFPRNVSNMLESYYARQAPVDQVWESHGYRIQRRCPYRRADLTRFAQIEKGILTCAMHGWQFELATGRCLNSNNHRLYAQPITQEDTARDT